MSTSCILAARYLAERKLRTALTTLAIVFGVAIIFGGNLTLPTFRDAFRRSVRGATDTVDLSIVDATGASFDAARSLAVLAALPGVQAATGVLRQPLMLPASLGSSNNELIELLGLDPATAPAVRRFPIRAGRFVQAGERGVLVLPASLAARLPQPALGTAFALPTARGLRRFTVVGLLDDRGGQLTPQLILPLADAQDVLHQPDMVNTLELALAPGADRDAVGARALKALGNQFQLDAGASEVDALVALNIGMAIFDLLGLLALFVGAFVIFNTFRTVIAERRHDLAMLRAIGASRRQVMRLIVVEALLQGVVGCGVGLVLGYGAAMVMTGLMNRLSPQLITPVHITLAFRWWPLVAAVLVGLLTTVIAGYLPARDAGRVSPLVALRPVAPVALRRQTRWGLLGGGVCCAGAMALLFAGQRTAAAGALLFLLGMVLLTPGLVVPVAGLVSSLLQLWFRREASIVQGNLRQQPGRAAISASTMVIALALLVTAAALRSSFDRYFVAMSERNLSSDLLLLPPSTGFLSGNVGADEQLAARLRALPEVAAVGTLRHAGGLVDRKPVVVLGIDPRDYPRVGALALTAGKADEAYAALGAGRNAIANSIMAATFKLKPGDSIAVQTASGPRQYRIAAIGDTLWSIRSTTLFISQTNLAADFRRSDDLLLMIKLRPGANLAAARAAVGALAAAYPQFSLAVTADYRKTMLDQSRLGLHFLDLLMALILIPAVLGLVNTLTINVLERTHEIGLLRAIGGSRRQIRRMVLMEALLLGTFGALLGALAGATVSYGFVMAFKGATGFALSYAIPWLGIASAVILGLVLALGASVLPAYNAAQIDIISALRAE